MTQTNLQLLTVSLEEDVVEGTDLAALILRDFDLIDGDIVIVTQKVVSKAEGRIAVLADNDPTAFDALVRAESRRILRRRGALAITETHHGFICANAGIDRSNSDPGTVTLLPIDPDRSARRLLAQLEHRTQCELAVIITDTFGRTWRSGVTDVAIGIAGLDPILDLRGTLDHNGVVLQATEVCVADELAAAADLVKRKNGRNPFVIVRGYENTHQRGRGSISTDVVRSYHSDLFR
ncbi:MAG: coenzyme F420-0:L-glutamate ligase [Ferrimicrobium sp.]|jgi:coenzyme F420-0:L-glutamate ligase/coenzyme F420-1:gamma-L-glutamate ligase|uniref:Coenzyme F420-0:L-glutamate ligase n=1 Tax=Ferrimicrobium acidiphilum TaxID=121039 RepID=A0ABV3XZ36_9ACTN|nr:coenzyme F420-0:L-glutamate ligase [Ferrimicrobium sp.]MCL5973624.1 coenzyme F420-0:L-glutamate ligase [Actinomycetota bacterium]